MRPQAVRMLEEEDPCLEVVSARSLLPPLPEAHASAEEGRIGKDLSKAFSARRTIGDVGGAYIDSRVEAFVTRFRGEHGGACLRSKP